MYKRQAKNEAAERFQAKIADEVIPAIRRTGSYSVRPMSTAQMLLAQAQWNVEQEQKIAALEASTARQEQKMEKVVEIFSVPSLDRDLWQQEMNRYISGLCESYGLSHQLTRGELYLSLIHI